MRLAQERRRGGGVRGRDGHVPHAIEETIRADDAFVRPRRFFFRRRDEERVDALGVGAEARDEIVGRDNVELRLRHLRQFGRYRLPGRLAHELVAAALHIVERDPLSDGGAVALLDDHALVEQPRERLLEVAQPHVVQGVRDKARVQQMEDGVLDAADVLVDRQPAIDDGGVENLRVVARGNEARVVPRRVDEGVHGVSLAPRRAAAFRTGGVDKPRVPGQRIAFPPGERHIERQCHRQLLLGHRHHAALIAVEHRNGRAPVALARDEPVAQAVAHHPLTDAALFDDVDDLLDRFRRR